MLLSRVGYTKRQSRALPCPKQTRLAARRPPLRLTDLQSGGTDGARSRHGSRSPDRAPPSPVASGGVYIRGAPGPRFDRYCDRGRTSPGYWASPHVPEWAGGAVQPRGVTHAGARPGRDPQSPAGARAMVDGRSSRGPSLPALQRSAWISGRAQPSDHSADYGKSLDSRGPRVQTDDQPTLLVAPDECVVVPVLSPA